MQKLYTEEGLRLPGVPWDRYPRPQLRRREWRCLNGEWEFRTEGFRRRKITGFIY